MTMKYAPVIEGVEALEPFYKLSPKLKEVALTLGDIYMHAVEHINCPICNANEGKRYDRENEACVQCWYGHLGHMAEGVAEDAGTCKRD